jgi:N-acetylglucosaminyldiphosphoundecaprenol N-acetyl-beta-D-mannosaminyltransferase
MAKMRPLLHAPLLVGVGAAFDFHAGLKAQAPMWIQEAGLEWAYRLAHEPRRLWRRYLRYNPRFLGAFARQLSERGRNV